MPHISKQDFMRRLGERFPKERLLLHEPMARHTTFRVGGPCDAMLLPKDENEIMDALALCREFDESFVLLGNGSNVIVRDGGIRGLVICLGEPMSAIAVEGNIIRAQAGALLSRVAAAALASSLTGFEFAAGIPGSVGGAVAMNAGAYEGEIGRVVSRARMISRCGEARDYTHEQMEFHYRGSRPQRTGEIVLSADFTLAPGDAVAIRAMMDDFAHMRREKQPLSLPSAGSTFKRPPGRFAGLLIEEAGLKGLRVGGAEVSTLHAGFLVNVGGATAEDVLRLIELVRERVYAHSGVTLETEVRLLGE